MHAQPIHITKIRAGRKKPGLKAQHLAGINLVSAMHGAEISGNALNSDQLTFKATKFDESKPSFTADPGTAG